MKTDVFKRLHSNQEGFSLVEVMIGFGLLGFVALGANTLFQSQNKQQSSITQDRELENYHYFVSKILTNNGHCNATLKPFADATSISAASNISSIQLCQTNCTSSSIASEVVTASLPFVSEGANSFIDSKKKWVMKSISFTSTQTRSGIIGLRFEYEPRNNAQVRNVIKDVFINTRFELDTVTNTYKFKACADVASGATSTFEKSICEALSPNQTSGIFVFNTSDNTCSMRTGLNVNCTGSNESLDGVAATGIPYCKTVANTPSPLTGAVNCASKKLKFAPQAEANGATTLKIVCN